MNSLHALRTVRSFTSRRAIGRGRFLSSAMPDDNHYAHDDDNITHVRPQKSSAKNIVDERPRLQALRQKLTDEPHPPSLKMNKLDDDEFSKEQQTKEENRIAIQKMIETIKKTQQVAPIVHGPAVEDNAAKNAINASNMLLDRYKRNHTYLRISLAERCNLRCQYCMPPEGVPLQHSDKLLNSTEILKLTRLFAASGVDKVRLTGGEPLLRSDIREIIEQIAKIPTMKSVGITTNGITLSRQIQKLVDSGMTHANISLDTLDEQKFVDITRRKGLNKVIKAIDDSCALLPNRTKINCVVMKNFNDMELCDFIMLSKDKPVDVRFIEWMPFNDNGWNANRFFSYQDMLTRIEDGGLELVRESDSANDTTKWYRIPGHMGRVGFITSMSEHFCGTCNRLRITADGELKVCLFGSQEVSLRDAMRAGVSDEDLSLLVGAAVRRKNFALGGHADMHGIALANDNRPMTLIGG